MPTDETRNTMKSKYLEKGDKLTFEYGSSHYDGTILEKNTLKNNEIEFVINVGLEKKYEIQVMKDEDKINYRITHINSDSRVATCYLKENADLVCEALNSTYGSNKHLRVKANNIEVIRCYNRNIFNKK